MGSRTRPNLGGAGSARTRIDWAANKKSPRHLLENGRFITPENLELYLSGDMITCLECGDDFRSLGHHLSRTHSMASHEYKIKYNIPVTRSLFGQSTKKMRKDIMNSMWESGRMDHLKPILQERMRALETPRVTASTLHHKEYKKICAHCGCGFVNKRNINKYCSRKCYRLAGIINGHFKDKGKKGGAVRAKSGKRNTNGKFEKDAES